MSEPAGYNRSACTECQRRKQKHRKIADECRYNSSNPPPVAASHDAKDKGKVKGKGKGTDKDKDKDKLPRVDQHLSPATGRPDADSPAPEAPGFHAMAAARLFTTLGIEPQVCPLLLVMHHAALPACVIRDASRPRNALPLLTRLPHGPDKLMTTFAHDVNYHYYIIYPLDFFRDYHIWWERRSKGRTITLQYTCLLATICACCIQHADNSMQEELQRASGLDSDELSEQLHSAARELASVAPVGHYHMFNAQRLLHSCYWYKAEARFLEAWHVLSAAILEARELNCHREPPAGTETKHEREMRRRLWCILDTWDWQISSGLSRPKIIDRVDCDAELPSLALEGISPSPLLHMKMQSELTRRLASRFSAPKNIINPTQVREYQAVIEDWVRQFPRVYDFDNPDTSKDSQYPWVFPHRYYVYAMACLLILNPMRHYMVKPYTWESPQEELSIRAVGVYYSLKLMKTLRSWVDKIYSRDGRLHFIIFSIFDTAAILCTAIIKDHEHTLTGQDEIMESIIDAVAMLAQLNAISKTSKTSYDLLERLVRRLPQPAIPRRDLQRKKAKASRVSTMPVPESAVMLEPALVPAPVNAAAVPCVPDYSNHRLDLQPALQAVPQNNFFHHNGITDVHGAIGSRTGSGSQTYSNYSPCSENTPPSTDDHMLSSFSTASDGSVPLDGFGQSVMGTNNFQPPPMDGGSAGFELETVTQAQLGELAPLWNWHSENLDFANMPSAGPGPVPGGPGGPDGLGHRPPQPPLPQAHPHPHPYPHSYPQPHSHPRIPLNGDVSVWRRFMKEATTAPAYKGCFLDRSAKTTSSNIDTMARHTEHPDGAYMGAPNGEHAISFILLHDEDFTGRELCTSVFRALKCSAMRAHEGVAKFIFPQGPFPGGKCEGSLEDGFRRFIPESPSGIDATASEDQW
ncbi:hypothetical protein TOPH_00114 [Tolypocladium ophioglossoides CBS 100239]|uniref:Xylanolytic transcriptional activator regulatory domain-containing protein n=1 Tax=Tolypocladium ophioglossoides (strain CBS 100239) TaxID=1163406 RepID=A0A0L0NMD2_TOLOC|nr:hypothetical protein TOPH_00114 [Tolypocladium ophioglossoides CBS 100239]